MTRALRPRPSARTWPDAPLKATAHAAMLAALAASASLAMSGTAFAQAAPAPATAASAAAPAAPAQQRVEITGSLIRRIDTETPLPIQTIDRESIARSGATTASEVMTQLSANVGGLTDAASINVGGVDQRGFNSANLRGLGTSSTLVLLNGRRLANFASPGADSGVDLNNIPAAAIDRIEVLMDGASAIYGSDAIGGVINFITRKDYKEGEIDAYALATQHGGAGKRNVSLSKGFGDLQRDGFNVFGTLSAEGTDALRSTQRSFIAKFDIPHTLGHLLSSRTFPANIKLSWDQIDQLNAAGYNFSSRLINFSAPKCNPPANVSTATGIGGVDGCTYDYMQDTEIYPASSKLNFLGRGTLALSPSLQLWSEVLLSRSKTRYSASAEPTNIYDLPTSLSPELTAAGVTGTFDARFRLTEAGPRTSTTTSDAQRYLLGLSGTVGDWEFDTAFNHSVNRAVDAYTHGYILYTPFLNAVLDGSINLFGTSSAAGQAVYDNNQINDKARVSVGVMDSIDARFSRSLAKLDGGDLALGVGVEFRHERVNFTPSALLSSNEILGDRDPEGVPIEATSNSRRAGAVYAELDAPVTKTLELQFALRRDQYQSVGGTTNPKLALRWTPTQQVLVRSSFGTGFRAPSVSELYRPTQYTSTISILPDPVYCKLVDNDLTTCADQWPLEIHSNPKLKPERSRQFSLGTVLQPTRQFSTSIDYWNIEKRDLISWLGEEVILADPEKYADLITRDPDEGYITNINVQLQNRGREKASGLDLVMELKDLKTSVGTFGARLSGTWMLESKVQTGNETPYVSNLNKFVNDKVVQRWRHRLTLDWERGDWGATLSNSWSAGYTDQNSAVDTNAGTVVASNHVKAYSLWDLSGRVQVTKTLTIRAGIKNLFDTWPPFSNQAYYFISGYDPTYTDPRGRSFFGNVNWKF